MTIDFSALDNFFSLNEKEKKKTLFNWGQSTLLPLKGKSLEKACADLVMYFRMHPEKEKCKNLIVPEHYWMRERTKPSKEEVNYSFKDWMLNVLVYKDCQYIIFNDNESIEVVPDNKSVRFVARDAENKKSSLSKKIEESGFTLEQKDFMWNGIVVGYLDINIPEKEPKPTKKSKVKK